MKTVYLAWWWNGQDYDDKEVRLLGVAAEVAAQRALEDLFF